MEVESLVQKVEISTQIFFNGFLSQMGFYEKC